MPILEVQHLYKNFGPTKVLKDISFTLERGKALAIIGSSGSGKTTLLRCLNFLETPNEGKIIVNGETLLDAADHAAKSDAQIRKNRLHFGMVFQSFNLFPQYTALENVMLAPLLQAKERPDYKQKKREIHEQIEHRAIELLEMMSLEGRMSHYPHQLSGGQQQRVALARALVIKPDVLLMDEPLSNLDAKLRVEMRTVIKEIQHTVGITNVYVTHDQEEAMAVSDRIAVINKGDIQQVGTPKDIYQRPANLFVATFIGRSNVLDGELRMENGKPVLHFHAGASITLDNVRAEECKNQPVKISVRPEEFILDASTDATGLKATVDSSVFLGLNTHYFAHTDDGDKIEIIQESQIDSIIPDGTVVRLGVKTEKINVFDAEGKQNLLEGVRNDNAV